MKVVIAIVVLLAGALLAWRVGFDENVSTPALPAKSEERNSAGRVTVPAPTLERPGSPSPPALPFADTRPDAVAETAFEVSASVHEFCGQTEWDACRQVEAFLDEMAN